MIDLTLFLTFLLLSAGFIVVPGANVLLIVATALSSGRVRGLQAVAGTTLAMAIQLLIAAFSTAALAAALSETFVWIKCAGVIYLAYLGLQHFRSIFYAKTDLPVQSVSGNLSFFRGFIVSLTNPKTILFFGAFLPQFISPAYPYVPQIALLSVSFLVLAAILDSLYAIGAGAVKSLVNVPGFEALRNSIIGSLFIGASVGLAISRRT